MRTAAFYQAIARTPGESVHRLRKMGFSLLMGPGPPPKGKQKQVDSTGQTPSVLKSR